MSEPKVTKKFEGYTYTPGPRQAQPVLPKNVLASNHRVQVLETASNLITGARADSYGSYRNQMTGIADMFNGLMHGQENAPHLDPRHISLILMLLKMRRRVTSGDLDSSVDLCGYTALDAEAFTAPEKAEE